MFCTLSNEPCEHPVIDKNGGYIYEKALIEKHLKITGKCPVTDKPMDLNDLIEVKGYSQPSRPRPPSASSIPSLLRTFQNEWDQIMLESYNLKKHCQTLRQELSHALYQYDASCRVIARLTQERDRLVQELTNTRQNMTAAIAQTESLQNIMSANMNNNRNNQEMNNNNNNNNKMEIDEEVDAKIETENNNNNNNNNIANENENKNNNTNNATNEEEDDITFFAPYMNIPEEYKNATELNENVKEFLKQRSDEIAQARKKRRKQQDKKPQKDKIISNYIVQETINVPSNNDIGITCMDIHPRINMQDYIVVGGIDSNISIINKKSKKIEHTLKAHRRKIRDVQFHPLESIIFSCSEDRCAIVWKYNNNNNQWTPILNMEQHNDIVVNICCHSISHFWATASLDGSWCFHNLYGKTLLQYDSKNPIHCMQLHPDGQILGVGGEDKFIKLWDIRNPNNIAASFAGHNNIPCCLSFNQNGYYLASGDNHGIVKIWDLRNVNEEHGQIEVPYKVRSVNFDHLGKYLAVANSTNVELYTCKKWKKFASFEDHKRDVSMAKIGYLSKYVVSASLDGTVKLWA